ncbi:MAG: TrkH family potassium uptake protein [Rickettsiales bacterium]|jgi:trk system potassium uptake protein|nr:TrkH family potassium uptake protein [Rickettsiales bacterium]
MIRVGVLFYVISIIEIVISILMIPPMILGYFIGDPAWQGFALAFSICFFFSVSIFLSCRGISIKDISIKETFLLTTLSWLSLAFIASLPFYFAGLEMSFVDCFFEAMSGVTTTGATIFADLDNSPKTILLWRAILNWIGGVGVIMLAIAILPMLKIGGMQLFRSESSDKSDKIFPRVQQISKAIGAIYIMLTIICFILYMIFDMTFFDAIVHSFTTVSTGGFSSHNASIGFFNDYRIEITVIIFMFIGSLPFPILIKCMNRDFKSFFRDNQIIALFFLLLSVIALLCYWLMQNHHYDFYTALRYSSFNVVAILTTTGYTSYDYYSWGGFAVILFFFIGVIGGCTGSTTGGIKIFRFQILFSTAKEQLARLIHPHVVYNISYSKNSVSSTGTSAVMGFFILFSFCFAIIATLLSFSGLDFITSFSAATAVMANLGPGLGDIIGPAGNYSSLSDNVKWILTIGMIVGRLEIFTIFILFTKLFWKD